MTETGSTEINLTPNYSVLIKRFADEARLKADTILADLPEPDSDNIKRFQAATLRALQGILALLNICAQAIDSAEAVKQLRDLLDVVTTSVRAKADEIEAQLSREEDYEQ